jgi:ribose 1,5-bisphosphokinase PhnN
VTLLAEAIAGLRFFEMGSRRASPKWEKEGAREVVICGPSAAGKTSIVNLVRKSTLRNNGAIVMPRRFVTRPMRENDDLNENVHLDPPAFIAREKSGEMAFTWTRRFSAQRTERYGFEGARDGLVIIYSANNALLEQRQSSQVERVLADALIVGVHASPDVRFMRFKSRNPALLNDAEEVRHRFGRDTPLAKWSHVVIDSEIASTAQLRNEVVSFFSRVLEFRRARLGLH